MTYIRFYALLPCDTCLQRPLDGLQHVRMACRAAVRDVEVTSRCAPEEGFLVQTFLEGRKLLEKQFPSSDLKDEAPEPSSWVHMTRLYRRDFHSHMKESSRALPQPSMTITALGRESEVMAPSPCGRTLLLEDYRPLTRSQASSSPPIKARAINISCPRGQHTIFSYPARTRICMGVDRERSSSRSSRCLRLAVNRQHLKMHTDAFIAEGQCRLSILHRSGE